MMSEEWKPIVGYEGLYEVSSLGQIRRLALARKRGKKFRTPRIVKPGLSRPGGYYAVQLYETGGSVRQQLIHRLVLYAFVGPPPDGYQGAHLNGNTTDNRVENLIWASPKENCSHRVIHGTALKGETAVSAKLTTEQVKQIRQLYVEGLSSMELGKRFGVTFSSICRIIRRETWKHVA